MSDSDRLRMEPKDMHFYIKALLECGARVEIFQRDKQAPWEMLVTPKAGTTVQDFVIIRDNNFQVHLSEGSALGVLQLMYMAAGGKLNPRPRKKLLGIF